MSGVFEPGAYAISASNARSSMLNQAVQSGSMTVFGDCVVALENHNQGVRVKTIRGQVHTAKSVIVTIGPWMARSLIPELKDLLDPRLVPIYWFKPKDASKNNFSAYQFPVFLYEHQDGALMYGVPSISRSEPGVKIGFHNRQQTRATPDLAKPPIQQHNIDEMSEAVKIIFPELEHTPTHAKNCFYTMSIDESFLIGRSHEKKSVYFASACSGHGFKFAPAIGDALANMAAGQQPVASLSKFEVKRFNLSSSRF